MKWILIFTVLFTTLDLQAAACRSYFYYGDQPLFIQYLKKQSDIEKYPDIPSVLGKKLGALELVAFFDKLAGNDNILFELLKNDVQIKRGKLSKRIFIRKLTALSKTNKIKTEKDLEAFLLRTYNYILLLNLRLSTLPWKNSPQSYRAEIQKIYEKAEKDFYTLLNQIRTSPDQNPILQKRDSRAKAMLFKYVWYAFIALPFIPLDTMVTSESAQAFLNSPLFTIGTVMTGALGARYHPLSQRYFNQHAFTHYLETGVIPESSQFINNLNHKWVQDQFFRVILLALAYDFVPGTIANLSHFYSNFREGRAVVSAAMQADYSHSQDAKTIAQTEKEDYQIYLDAIAKLKAQKQLSPDQKDELKAYEDEIRRLELKLNQEP